MRYRHIIILTLLFIGLLAFLGIKKILVKPEIETVEYQNLAFSLEDSHIYSFDIKKGGEEEGLRFEKKDGEWFIPSKWDAKAKGEKIEGFLKDLAALKGELRSNSKELFSDYGISDSEAYSFSFYDKEGDLKERLFLGIKRPEYGKSFVRRYDSSEVYLVDKDIFSMLGIYSEPKDASLNVQGWIDFSILSFDIEKIDSLRVERLQGGRKILTVDVKRVFDEEKKLKRWITEAREAVFPLDVKKIKEFLRRLDTISATEIVDPEGKNYGLDEPYLTISIIEGGVTLELLVGKLVDNNSEQRYVKTPEGYVYIMPGYRMKGIDIDVSEFFIDNPLRVEKEKLQEVNIKTPEKSITLGEALFDKNKNYIDKLKNFSIEKILFTAEEYQEALRGPTDYSLTVATEEGGSLIIDIEEVDDGRYIAKLRTNPTIFLIERKTFKNIFKELDELNLEVEEKI